jgi:hypothetical protein
VFAKVLARLMVVSARTKVKSLVSIPIPTIGNLIVHVDYCTKNHQGSKINGGHGTWTFKVPDPLAALEISTIPKVPSNLIGKNIGATPKSIYIWHASLSSLLRGMPDVVASLEDVYIVPKSKEGIIKWGMTFR